MNKKLLTAAIAAVIAAPTAALANDVTMYGVAHVSVDWLDSSNAAIDGFDMQSRASRLGFMGTEDLSNGLKAIWNMEFQVDMADAGGCPRLDQAALNTGTAGVGLLQSPTVGQGNFTGTCVNQQNDLWSTRNMYVGLAGGFGTFLIGRHDTPYKMSTGKLDLFSDELGDYNSTLLMTDIRTSSAIAYVSPNWSGFSFAAATVAPHIYYNNGTALNTADDYDSDDLAGAYSLSATFNASGFFASVAYEVLTSDWLNAWAGQATGGLVQNPDLDDDTKWRAGLGWTGMGFTVGGVYEQQSNVLGFEQDKDSWQISAGYTFGNNMVKAMYGQVEFDGGNTALVNDNDVESWAIGLDHNLSKRTKAYIQYVDKSTDIDFTDVSGVSIGMVHKF
jgi:predicted porin